MNAKDIFTNIYDKDGWPGSVSKSGKGSDNIQTEVLQERIPQIISEDVNTSAQISLIV
jgi:hypothetical protein